MSIIDDRLSLIFERLNNPKFLENQSLSNDMPYWVFDYNPEDELIVRDYLINKLVPRFAKEGFNFHTIDLYDVMLNILDSRNLLERAYSLELSKGFDHLKKTMDSVLEQKKVAKHIVDLFLKDNPSFIILHGVGNCFPYIKAPALLNALHGATGYTPVLIFFPGNYDGNMFETLNVIEPDPYYRAFRLVPEKTSAELKTSNL